MYGQENMMYGKKIWCMGKKIWKSFGPLLVTVLSFPLSQLRIPG